jgi:hypothetical protein
MSPELRVASLMKLFWMHNMFLRVLFWENKKIYLKSSLLAGVASYEELTLRYKHHADNCRRSLQERQLSEMSFSNQKREMFFLHRNTPIYFSFHLKKIK